MMRAMMTWMVLTVLLCVCSFGQEAAVKTPEQIAAEKAIYAAMYAARDAFAAEQTDENYAALTAAAVAVEAINPYSAKACMIGMRQKKGLITWGAWVTEHQALLAAHPELGAHLKGGQLIQIARIQADKNRVNDLAAAERSIQQAITVLRKDKMSADGWNVALNIYKLQGRPDAVLDVSISRMIYAVKTPAEAVAEWRKLFLYLKGQGVYDRAKFLDGCNKLLIAFPGPVPDGKTYELHTQEWRDFVRQVEAMQVQLQTQLINQP